MNVKASVVMTRRLEALGFKIIDPITICRYSHRRQVDEWLPNWVAKVSGPYGEWPIHGFNTLRDFDKRPFAHMSFVIDQSIGCNVYELFLEQYPQSPPKWLAEWPKDPRNNFRCHSYYTGI